jgi:hypothetical protein
MLEFFFIIKACEHTTRGITVLSEIMNAKQIYSTHQSNHTQQHRSSFTKMVQSIAFKVCRFRKSLGHYFFARLFSDVSLVERKKYVLSTIKSSSTNVASSTGAAMVAGSAMLIETSGIKSLCEDYFSLRETTDEQESQPLWPDGISQADIEELVQEIVNDPNINISVIPDALERRIYKSTIQLTVNAFYCTLASIDGLPFLSHQIKLTRVSKGEAHKKRTTVFLAEQAKSVNVEVLEEIADRLLSNPVINVRVLPDAMERQLYINCMVVIFRVLAVIMNSFRLTICGHDLGLKMEPHIFEDAAKSAVTRSSLSRIDIEEVRKFAVSCGIPQEDSESMTEGFSLFDRIANRRGFIVNMHTCLYSLVLGILDDILANSKIRILNDDISLDVVPSDALQTQLRRPQPVDNRLKATTREGNNEGLVSGRLMFFAGLVAGLGLSSIINKR